MVRLAGNTPWNYRRLRTALETSSTATEPQNHSLLGQILEVTLAQWLMEGILPGGKEGRKSDSSLLYEVGGRR